MNLRYPNLTAGSADGQVQQLVSYLHQLVDELNMSYQQQEAVSTQISNTVKQTAASVPKTPLDSFNNIKALIISSADIVNSYSEAISKQLEGKYVAISDFGTYTEEQLAKVNLTSKMLQTTVEQVGAITGEYNLLQQSISRVEQQADSVSVRVASLETDGVTEIKTENNYTFNKNGLRISEAGQPISNTLTNDGMYVKYGDTPLLRATKDGVLGNDVTIKNYLIVGDNARFEDYSDGSDKKRTACFWIGG